MGPVSIYRLAGSRKHHHAREPFSFSGEIAAGLLAIVDTPAGERFHLTLTRHANSLTAEVAILRPSGRTENLQLIEANRVLESQQAPEEPHEFDGELRLTAGDSNEALPFHMSEPAGHAH